MKITLSTIRNHEKNKTFFKNASFLGDKSYRYNDDRKELTVKMQWGSLKRTSVWRIGTDGEILDLVRD